MSGATLTPARIRDASPADAAAIERVARASWADTYADIFDASYISSFLSTAYDPVALAQAAERAASDDERHFLVAERDGEVVAFARLRPRPARSRAVSHLRRPRALRHRCRGRAPRRAASAHCRSGRPLRPGCALAEHARACVLRSSGIRHRGWRRDSRMRPDPRASAVPTARRAAHPHRPPRPASPARRCGRHRSTACHLRRCRDDAVRRRQRTAAPGYRGDASAAPSSARRCRAPRVHAVGTRRAGRRSAHRDRGAGLGGGPWPGGGGRLPAASRSLGSRICHRGAACRPGRRPRPGRHASESLHWRTRRTSRRSASWRRPGCDPMACRPRTVESSCATPASGPSAVPRPCARRRVARAAAPWR